MSTKSFLNNTMLPRGIRNNNPGNLVRTSIDWEGKVPLSDNPDGRFEQFYFLVWGIRAMMRDIINDYNKGKKTVTALISEFAPSFENNTAAYIASVASTIGVTPYQTIQNLDAAKVIAIAKAIVMVENGQQAANLITHDDYALAYQLRNAVFQKKK